MGTDWSENTNQYSGTHSTKKRLQNWLNLIKQGSFWHGAKNRRTIDIISNAQDNKQILKNLKYLDSICSSLSI